MGIPLGTLIFIRTLQTRIETFVNDCGVMPTLAFRSELGTAPWLTSNKKMYRQRRVACAAVLSWHFYLMGIGSLKTQSATKTCQRFTGMGRRRVQRARRDIIAAGIFERVLEGGGRLSQILEAEGWVDKIATFRVSTGALKQMKLFDFWKKVEAKWVEKKAQFAEGVRGAWMTAAVNQKGGLARRVARAKTPAPPKWHPPPVIPIVATDTKIEMDAAFAKRQEEKKVQWFRLPGRKPFAWEGGDR